MPRATSLTVSPIRRLGIPQANSTTSMPRRTSPAASFASLPFSNVTRSRSSSKCSSRSALKRKSTWLRCTTGVADQSGNASSAFFTARSTSSLVERGVSAMISPVAGSYTGSVSRPSRSSQEPPIRFLTSRFLSRNCTVYLLFRMRRLRPTLPLKVPLVAYSNYTRFWRALLAPAPESLQVLLIEGEGRVQEVHVRVHRLRQQSLEGLHLLLGALHHALGHGLAVLHPLPQLGRHVPEEALDEVRALLLQAGGPLDDILVGIQALGEGAIGTLLAPDRLFDDAHVGLHRPGERPVGLRLALENPGKALDPALRKLHVPLLGVHGSLHHPPVGFAERLRQILRRLRSLLLRHPAPFCSRYLSQHILTAKGARLSRRRAEAIAGGSASGSGRRFSFTARQVAYAPSPSGSPKPPGLASSPLP